MQTVMDGLAVVKESLPDGNWQQIAAHLAAPGQQQISHQLQQIQATQVQMQATMAQMQATTAQLQEDFTAMRWNQANSAIRFQNRNNRGFSFFPGPPPDGAPVRPPRTPVFGPAASRGRRRGTPEAPPRFPRRMQSGDLEDDIPGHPGTSPPLSGPSQRLLGPPNGRYMIAGSIELRITLARTRTGASGGGWVATAAATNEARQALPLFHRQVSSL